MLKSFSVLLTLVMSFSFQANDEIINTEKPPEILFSEELSLTHSFQNEEDSIHIRFKSLSQAPTSMFIDERGDTIRFLRPDSVQLDSLKQLYLRREQRLDSLHNINFNKLGSSRSSDMSYDYKSRFRQDSMMTR